MNDLPDLDLPDVERSRDDELIMGYMDRAEQLDLLLNDDSLPLCDPDVMADFLMSASRFVMSVLPFFKIVQRPTGEVLSTPPTLTSDERRGILLGLNSRVDQSLAKLFSDGNLEPDDAGVVTLRRLHTNVLGTSRFSS